MADEKYLFNFTDGGSLDRLGQKVLDFQNRIEQLRQSLANRGATPDSVNQFAVQFDAAIAGSKARIEELYASLQKLNAALLKGPNPNGTFNDPTNKGRFTPQADFFAKRDQIQQQLASERLQLNSLLIASEEALATAGREDLGIQESINTVIQRRNALYQLLKSVRAPGGLISEVAEARQNNLLERRRQLLQQVAQLRVQISRQTPRNTGEAAFKAEEAAEERLVKLYQRKVILANQRRIILDQIAKKDLAQTQGEKGPLSDEEQAKLREEQAKAQERLADNGEQLNQVERRITEQVELRAKALAEIQGLETAGGASAGLVDLLQRLSEVNQQLAALDVNQLEALNQIAGTDLNQAFQGLIGQIDTLKSQDLAPEEEARQFQEINAQAQGLLKTLESLKTEKMPQLLDPNEQFKSLPMFERTLIGAFQGIGQRFRATLQFALSGAILFQAQRLAREFIQAAIEVERTFADISTAFQFDIQLDDPNATRGTAEFERRIEGIRRGLVDLADELQALPVDVNQAAYEMVSRFQDADAALIATRAQVLATKIATISQAEALQALTAVAESYGQTLDSSIQGQERQIALANIYKRALDGAVAIQQQYGITVEETLEGSAGLAELFAQQGFSLAQTQAALALVIQRTGVTGASAADKLGRAISQLTAPETRDQLLALADATDHFFLTMADFSDGEEALRRINEELVNLSTFDPTAAEELQRRIAQIIGQRRETAFIAPLLGTADLQKEATKVVEDSANAAEDRFGVLAKTTSEIIQSIIGQFQELAQNLQQLGFLSPIKVLLLTLDGVLNALNWIIRRVQDLVGVLNFLDFGGIRFGNMTSQLLTAVLAAAAFKRAIDGIRIAVDTLAKSRLAAVTTSLLGPAVEGGTTAIAGAGLASRGFQTFRKTVGATSGELMTFGQVIKGFFMNPVQLMGQLVIGLYASMTKLFAAMSEAAGATLVATEAEVGLSTARTYGPVSTFMRTLGTIGRGVATAAVALGKLALAAAAITEVIWLITGLVKAISNLPSAITGAQRAIEGGREGRLQALQAEAAVSGKQLGPDELSLKEVEQSLADIKKRRDDLATAGGTVEDALLTVLSAFEFLGFKSSLGTNEGLNIAEAAESFRYVDLQLGEYAKSLGALLRQRDLMSPEDAAKLDEQMASFRALSERYAALARLGLDFETPEGQRQSFNILAAMQAWAASYVEDFGLDVDKGTEGAITTIQDGLRAVTEKLQLGDIDFGEALSQTEKELVNAQALLAQAETQEDKQQLEGLVREARQQIVTIFDQQAQFQERLALIPAQTSLEQSAVRLESARATLERAITQFGATSGLVRLRRIEVLEAEKAYAQTVLDEMEARYRVEADSARTFDEQIQAWKNIRSIIISQIVTREGIIDWITGNANITAEEMRNLIEADNAIADAYLQRDKLEARLAILEQASTQDNIAAIAANIAGLQVEIATMRAHGEDELRVREKLQELRQAQADLLLAEAERRAAYYDLTAGVGNEIASAQARLKGALEKQAAIVALGGAETQAGYEAEQAVLEARAALADLAIRQADLQRRVASDLTDSLEQAYLDVQLAQQKLAQANGPLEKLAAEKALSEAQNAAQKAFYDRRLADLDFLYRTDEIGKAQYIAALRTLQASIDRTTRQGEELWRSIELQIRSLSDQAANMAFNIPTDIQLPTLFEVRRALAADSLGVNYQDNRQQDINLFVSSDVDLDLVLQAINDRFGSSIDVDSTRLAAGNAGITIGGF